MSDNLSTEEKVQLEGIFTRLNSHEENLKTMFISMKTLNEQIRTLRDMRDGIAKERDKLIEEAKEEMITLEALLKNSKIKNYEQSNESDGD